MIGRKIMRWCIFLMLTTVGAAAFFVLCGDEAPGHTMSCSFFFWSKLIAEAILLLCYCLGRYCSHRGLLPEFKELEEEEWED